MKKNLCDVCANNGVARESQYRSSVKHITGSRIALDTCHEHKGVFKGKTFEQALDYATKEINTIVPVSSLVVG